MPMDINHHTGGIGVDGHDGCAVDGGIASGSGRGDGRNLNKPYASNSDSDSDSDSDSVDDSEAGGVAPLGGATRPCPSGTTTLSSRKQISMRPARNNGRAQRAGARDQS